MLKLPKDQQPCFKCGKPGHQSKNCPTNNAAARVLTSDKPASGPAAAPGQVRYLGLCDAEGFQRPRRTAALPQPKPYLLEEASVRRTGLSQRQRREYQQQQQQKQTENRYDALGDILWCVCPWGR